MHTDTASSALGSKLTVICGANEMELDEVGGKTVRQIREQLREILSIHEDHNLVYVDGREVNDLDYVLSGKERLEFKKPSGRKG